MKIFTVNHEEWGIAAVYSSRSAAEQWVAQQSNEYAYRVDELTIDEDYQPTL